MARLTKESQYEQLSKELGRVDKERRAILDKIRKTPEFVSKHLFNTLKTFISNNSWFSNTNAKGEKSYFKLIGFRFGGKGKFDKTEKPDTAEITKHGSALISVELEWDYYNYGSAVKEKKTESVIISVFNEVEKQVLNGRIPASTFDEKKLLKAQLMDKKAKLKEELKSLELELKTI